MAILLTDVHTHSTYSPDGISPLKEMLDTAQEKGLCFYGVSEHVDYDMLVAELDGTACEKARYTDAEAYFHDARRLQEKYAGALNVLVGAEFGYTDDKRAWQMYRDFIRTYRPDFVVNSIHTLGGKDYCHGAPFYREEQGNKVLRPKEEVYREYFRLVLRSVQVEYDYDIVGHICYCTRYAPYEDREAKWADYAQEIDDILKEIIARGKILEINSSNKGGVSPTLPDREIVARYFELGGRAVSYGSDAHGTNRVADKRDEVVRMLKEIGFTYITVPCKGEYVRVEI